MLDALYAMVWVRCYFKRRVTVVVVAAAISCDNDDTALFRQALDSHSNSTHALNQFRAIWPCPHHCASIAAKPKMAHEQAKWHKEDPRKKVKGGRPEIFLCSLYVFWFESILALAKTAKHIALSSLIVDYTIHSHSQHGPKIRSVLKVWTLFAYMHIRHYSSPHIHHNSLTSAYIQSDYRFRSFGIQRC